jgi:hypothetical protein
VKGLLLLCDFAEEINGKLYIMGGGWSRLALVQPEATMAIALKLLVPWTETNRPHAVLVRLVTQDGSAVLDAAGQPVEVSGRVEVGKPAGLPEGTDIDVPMAFRVERLSLRAGRFRWELLVNDKPVQSASFEVVDLLHDKDQVS